MFDPFNNLLEKFRQQKGLPLWLGLILLFMLLSLAVIFSNGLTPLPGTEPGLNPATDGASLAVGVFFRFAVVIALLYIGFILVRRWQASRKGAVQSRLAILERLHLSPRQALYLVRMGSREFLVGATDQALSLITEVEPGAETFPGGEDHADGDFSEVLGSQVKRNSIGKS